MARVAFVAVVRPQRAEAICQRLLETGWVEDLAVLECRGYGRQKGHLDSYQASEYRIDFLPKVRISGLVPASRADEAAAIMVAAARTGRIGDGKVFLLPVEQVVDESTALPG